MIKPLREQILIELTEPEDKTFGGIIIPENAREKPRRAKVIAVGDGWHNDKNERVTALAVKPGDVILVGSNLSGVDVKHEGKDYEMIRENFIFGIIKGSKPVGEKE